MRRRGPSGPDIRDVKPTTIILDCRMQINGGSLSSPEIGRVWAAVHKAFAETAHECGLGYSWMGEVGCTDPARMRKRIERLGLHVYKPAPSVDAVREDVAPAQGVHAR